MEVIKSVPEQVKVRSKPGLSLAEYLAAQIDMSPLTQREIAQACGWEKPNIVTMVKQGLTRLPLPKVAPLATALGIDPPYLMRLALQEYQPETWEAMQDVFGFVGTSNEREIIEELRRITKDQNPRMITSAAKKKLREFAEELSKPI